MMAEKILNDDNLGHTWCGLGPAPLLYICSFIRNTSTSELFKSQKPIYSYVRYSFFNADYVPVC